MRKRSEKNTNGEMNKKESLLVTKESLGATCALFSFLALLILCSRSLIFGSLGVAVHSFLTGVFGYLAYPLVLGALYLSITSLLGKKYVKNKRAGVCIALILISVALIIHTAITWKWSLSGYISRCFKAGELFPKATVTGWLGGVIVYCVVSVTSKIGALIFFGILTAFFGYLAYVVLKKNANTENSVEEKKGGQDVVIPLAQNPTEAGQAIPVQSVPVQNVPMTGYNDVREVPVQSVAPQPVQTFQERFGGPTVSQRPGVRLQEENTQNGTQNTSTDNFNGFSPFGTSQTMQDNPMPAQENYEDPRAFLFGGTPAENYKRNLIFDPNSQVNKRPPFDPKATTVQNSYTPSYSDSYQNSVNDGGVRERPIKTVTNVSPTYSLEQNQTVSEPIYQVPELPNENENVSEPIVPMSPISDTETRPVQQQPLEYPSYTPENDRIIAESVRENEPIDLGFSSRGNEDLSRNTESEERNSYRRHDYMDLFSTANPNIFGREESTERNVEESTSSFRDTETFTSRENESENRENISGDFYGFDRSSEVENTRGDRDGINLLDEDESDPYSLRSDYSNARGDDSFERTTPNEVPSPIEDRTIGFVDRGATSFGRDTEQVIPEPPKPTPPPPPKPRIPRPYVRVRLDDLDCRDIEPTANQEEVELTKQDIIATLEDFKVTGASIASVTFGPTVTRYNVTLPRSISPKKVVALDQSIAISLHSSGVNVYPNYEDGVVSIEVPNKDRQFVQLGCMLSGDTFVNSKSSSLMFAMGKDVANRKIYGDISKMIHLLVAGSSGSGKSVFLGSLIISLIYKYSPEELRLILIDPKKTEFVLYNDLPHLMINEIITDVNKTVQSLNWAIGEMNRRYSLFEQMSRSGTYVVNLDQYNAQLEKNERLPKIVIIIDELADLMLAAKKEIEDRVQNLTQKARAAGIHLIVATQRPSTDVITGVIKSNLPTRIAFGVATDVDSRVILDQTGAQKLLGKGDFLYTMPGINAPVRVQSAFISPEESQRVVNFIKSNNEAYYDEEATAYINNARGGVGDDSSSGDKENVDPMYIEALKYVILSGSASISMIQRKCSAGYNRAGKIIEWMEDMGYISAFDGAKARKVLITKEEFESKYGPLQ